MNAQNLPPASQPQVKLVLCRKSDWAKDSEHKKCMRCSAGFSLFLRRHHCRACGHVVCNKCGPSRRFPNHSGPLRVCLDCLAD